MTTTIATMIVIKIAAKQIATIIITFVGKEIAILIERTLSVD